MTGFWRFSFMSLAVLLTSAQMARTALADMIDTSDMAPWEVCGLCHSLDGISPMAKFPKLAGQRAAYIEKQIRDFHGNRRSNDGGQMQAITTEVDLAELSEIATYFASLPAPPPAPLEEKEAEQAEILFASGRGPVPACLSCHGKTDPDLPLAPWLEAQHADYLAKQLTDFKKGDRTNDPGGIMRTVAAQLSDDDIKALAAFIAARKRPERTP